MILYRKGDKNFGDAVNDFMWKSLMPDIFEKHPEVMFLGIGSILDKRIPEIPSKKVILGAGLGFPFPMTPLDANWKFYGVRGPWSAHNLKLDPDLAVLDPAYLLSLLEWPPINKNNNTLFIPHETSDRSAPYKAWCRLTGLKYISPLWDSKYIINEIRQAKLVISEAMHGAIVADAFRIPWIGIALHNSFREFKWKDWLNSVEMEDDPVLISDMPIEWGIRAKLHRLYASFKQVLKVKVKLHSSCGSMSSDNVFRKRMMKLTSIVSDFANDYELDLNPNIKSISPNGK